MTASILKQGGMFCHNKYPCFYYILTKVSLSRILERDVVFRHNRVFFNQGESMSATVAPSED